MAGQRPKTVGRDLTILLLGETGVGKSTWINGFANFLQYETLEEAESNPTLCVIPTSFTMMDKNYKEYVVKTGSDENEDLRTGRSATQHPQSYIFPNEGNIIRLIDTPGIGDVRGTKQDEKNFELILDHISHLDELHAICILLKPNDARLNIMFTFCIKELLTHLHKDACRNIVFCFTNTRGTSYRPGDTLPALRALLEESIDVKIPISQSTLYCTDNDSIRFLYAVKDGVSFSPEDRKNYVESWDNSVTEIGRLLKHVLDQHPHPIQNTLSLNNARQTILKLRSPMAEISRNIQTNIALSEKQRQELSTNRISHDELKRSLVINQVDVIMKVLDQPRTICTADKCVDLVQVGFETKTNYKTHCHKNCSRGKQKTYKVANIVGHKSLQKCSAFDAKHCGCSWQFHMKITYETSTQSRAIVDGDKQREITMKEDSIKSIQVFLKTLDTHLNELREEQKEITKANVMFAGFLIKNAITPYNDSLVAYLTHFINEEGKKIGRGGDTKVLEGMIQMRKDYEDQMDVLKNAMKEGKQYSEVTTTDLDDCIRNLYKMKHSGENLRQMMSTSGKAPSSKYSEKRIERTHSITNEVKSEKKKRSLFNQFTELFGKTGLEQQGIKKIAQPRRDLDENDNKLQSGKPMERSIDSGIHSAGSTYSSTPVSQDPSDGLQVIPRKELVMRKRLGEGGFGVVATGFWNGTECAIKQVRAIVTNQMDYEGILQEARIQHYLKHPNIVQLYGISYEDDLWLVMQYVNGKNLFTMLLDPNNPVKEPSIPIRAKIKIAQQATNAISYIHEKGYLHNDIKPDNMIIEKSTGNLYICDFGITRYLGQMDVQSFASKYTTSFGGTMPYVAPECFQRDAAKKYLRPTFKSDVWSLAVVLLELFLEKELFPNDEAVYACKLRKDYKAVKAAIKALPPSVSHALRDALDASPDKRPTAKKMNELFRQVSPFGR